MVLFTWIKNALFFLAGTLALASASAWAAQPGDVVINEIAWMGTFASTNDEWIELFNPTLQPIHLTGWTLIAADGSPAISLAGTIPANGFFLLERTDQTTVSDIAADQLYAGSLSNSGESPVLRDDSGTVIDTANGDGGGWPAGNATQRRTMERVDTGAPDTDANWASNDGVLVNGLDANGSPLNGTPAARNSTATSPGPTVVYVKSGGSDLHNGLSTATPFATIQRGLNVLPPAAKIVVLGGTFHEQLDIAKPVTLQAVAAASLSADVGTSIAIRTDAVEVTGFSIVNSAQGVAVSAGASGVVLARNAFVGNTLAVANQSASPVIASNNWWGCNAGPNQTGCDTTSGSVSASTWLVATLDAFPNPANARESAQILLNLNHNNRQGVVETALARPVAVHISDGQVRPLQQFGALSLAAWFVAAVFGLGWAKRLRRCRLVAGALLLCVGLTSCGLFFGSHTPTPQTFNGPLRQGMLWLEVLPRAVGAIQLDARLDGQAWGLELQFILRD